MKVLMRNLGIPATARDWHSFIAMSFLLILLFLFVTGTLSVFGREIDWLLTPEQRVEAAGEIKQSFGAIYDSVQQRYPDAQQLSILRFKGERFADHVAVSLPGQGNAIVYVNPYDALVQGTGPAMNTRRLLRELHRGFASEISSVNKLVTLMVLPLAAILISSLLLYPRFYRGLLRFPRRGTRLRAQLSDLHRLVGSWCVMFLMVLVMTSAQFMIESIGLGPNFYPSYAKKVSGDEPLMKEGFSGADLDMLVTLAQETYPGLDVSDIVLPSRPGEPLAIRGQLTSKLVRPSANSVNIDPFTFEVRGAYRAETSGNGLWIFEAMRVIHYGSFAGLTSRVLWVIFGLGLSLLAALGALIYAERLVFQSERSKRFPRRSRLEYVWVGMGIGKWAGLIAIAGALWWTID